MGATGQHPNDAHQGTAQALILVPPSGQASRLVVPSACARRATICPCGPSASAGRLPNAPHHSDATHADSRLHRHRRRYCRRFHCPGSLYGQDGRSSVLLLERESQPGYHTTGRSAALYMATYGAQHPGPDARQPCVLRRAAAGVWRRPHPSPRGVIYVAGPDQLDMLKQAYDDARAASPMWSGWTSLRCWPSCLA